VPSHKHPLMETVAAVTDGRTRFIHRIIIFTSLRESCLTFLKCCHTPNVKYGLWKRFNTTQMVLNELCFWTYPSSGVSRRKYFDLFRF
jgi:hypothetical protein